MEYKQEDFFVELNLQDEVRNKMLTADRDKLISKQKEMNYAHPFIRGDNLSIPDSAIQVLEQVGLTVHPEKCLFFMVPPNTNGPLHTDGHTDFNNERPFGLNWIWNGDDSVMEWYEPVRPPTYKKLDTGLELYHYKLEDCQLVKSQKLTGINLINTGIPHLVKNFKSTPRFCLSICPKEKVPYHEAVELFRSKGLLKQN